MTTRPAASAVNRSPGTACTALSLLVDLGVGYSTPTRRREALQRILIRHARRRFRCKGASTEVLSCVTLDGGRPVGRVVGLWRYPVKSMAAEPLAEVDVSWHGFAGDRRWAFVRDGVPQSGFPWLTLRERADMSHYRSLLRRSCATGQVANCRAHACRVSSSMSPTRRWRRSFARRARG